MEYGLLIFVIILIAYTIKFFVRKYYLPKIKGVRGENRISRLLRKLNKNEYKVFNDIYIKSNGKSTQIDHLIISIYGIFVIESKNYNGWIHGNEKSEYWTQTFYKKRQKFRNPIKQNWAHIYFLKEILSSFNHVKYHSVIVFVGDGELKNIYSSIPVIYKNELIGIIKQNKILNLSVDQVESIVIQLNKFIAADKDRKKEHKKYVKRNIHERNKKTRRQICPNCNGELIIRKGNYGKFYGCVNFPKCKFSKSI